MADATLVLLICVVLGVVVLGKLIPLTGHPTIVIGGSSMKPSIDVGAAVVLDRVDPALLRVGEVVSVSAGPARPIVTHRIVRVVDQPDGGFLALKGDANGDEDPTLVPASAVVGRVTWTLPFAGYALTTLSVPAGAALVMGLALALFTFSGLLDLHTTRKAGRGRHVIRKIPIDRPGSMGWPSSPAAQVRPSSNRYLVLRPAVIGTPGVRRVWLDSDRRWFVSGVVVAARQSSDAAGPAS
jgi:signal peptidase I